MVLLRKEEEPLKDASSYGSICLMDTIGKLLEGMILQRLQRHMFGKNSLSENKFGFIKNRSTVDAIQAVVDIPTLARIGAGKRRGFFSLISIDIRNAFNTARWNICIEAKTDRRSFQYPKIVLGEHEVVWKKIIKYLGVQLDRRLSFGEYLQITTAKAMQCGANLARPMPNIGRPKEAMRRLLVRVVHSKLRCATPIWAIALSNHAIQKKLFSSQRGAALRIVSAYQTVSRRAVLVLASVSTIDALAKERQETFQLRKEVTCITDLQVIARVKKAFRKKGRRKLDTNMAGDMA